MTATPPLSAPHKRSDGIDLLRGVAVLMVMAAHAPFSTQGGMGHAAGTAVVQHIAADGNSVTADNGVPPKVVHHIVSITVTPVTT